jgi:hypothetical protein
MSQIPKTFSIWATPDDPGRRWLVLGVTIDYTLEGPVTNYSGKTWIASSSCGRESFFMTREDWESLMARGVLFKSGLIFNASNRYFDPYTGISKERAIVMHWLEMGRGRPAMPEAVG